MHVGQYISGAGHLGLIGWMLLGGLFTPEPEPFEMTEVSVISGADFDAMIAAQQAPEQVTEVAQPAAPEVTPEAPEVAPTPDEVIEQPAPVVVETPPEDTPPEVVEQAAPEPEPQDAPADLSEPVGETAVLVPETAPEAAPRPVERVAPEPVAQPDPEAIPDPVAEEAVAEDETGDAPEQEAQEEKAPEEAVTEVVTEATKAPAASSRPPGRRPAAPVRQAETETERQVEVPTAPAPESEPATTVQNDDVLAALQAAQEAVAAPSGPPLSRGEKDALRAQIAQCWNIGSLSTEALSTTVVIAVSMTQNAKPVVESIRMLSASGGSDGAARRVFDSARRAIIRCGASGYDLPADKFDQWRSIEMTFDPRKMGLR